MAVALQYRIEVHQDSILNDPAWTMDASTPFPALAKGDVFNHRALGELAWDPYPTEDQAFVISKIQHIFWQTDGGQAGHTLSVVIEATEISN